MIEERGGRPTIFEIWKAGAVKSYRPDPYVVTVANCAMWVFYGMPFITKDNTLVITINGAGLIIELLYVSIFFKYSNWPKRRKIIVYLIIEWIFIFIIVAVTMTVIRTERKRFLVVGIVCIILTIGMYIAPLTVMRRVLRTKSVKYMPFTLSAMNFINGCIWFAYAFMKFDLFILIPNGLGAFSGLGQLLLYVIYYGSTNWDRDTDDDSPRNLQLPISNEPSATS
ncbi:hypothetical protein Leryth_006562 [Lithospermum erythrorhizon]|nr:hypothetical protein Leryth_006562 [Lithospermum erythrorhizon]